MIDSPASTRLRFRVLLRESIDAKIHRTHSRAVVPLSFNRSLAQAPLAPEAYQQLKYRYIGPVGNRTTAVIGIAGNPTGDDQDHGECWYPSSPDLCVFTRVQIVVLSVEKKEVKALLS